MRICASPAGPGRRAHQTDTKVSVGLPRARSTRADTPPNTIRARSFFFEQRSEHDLDPVQGYRIGLDCVWAHVARRTRRTALLGRVPAVRGKTNNACAGAVGAARPTATGMCARGSGGGGAGTAPASRWPVASFPAPHGAILPSLFARQEASSSTRRRA
jgi:hypothetical protein